MFLLMWMMFVPGEGPYDAKLDANDQIEQALIQAKSSGKHVLIQVGGNWCSWCLKLDKLLASDEMCQAQLSSQFVFIHVNYSKENKNLAVMERLEFPQRFGFPVWVILDSDGRRLHTQESSALEAAEGKVHDPDKVLAVLKNWGPEALEKTQYQN